MVTGHWSVYKWRFYCATALSLLPSENQQVWLDDIAERKEHFYLEKIVFISFILMELGDSMVLVLETPEMFDRL